TASGGPSQWALRTRANLPRSTPHQHIVTGTHMRLDIAEWQFWLDDQPRILRLAWLPYAQLKTGAWRDACERARDAGIQGLLVPISWEHHAPAADVLDLDGSTDARRDLTRLLSIVADVDLGLVPIAMPADFGTTAARLPAWLLGPNREPPSLWDRAYRDATGGWHEALVQTVAAIAPDAALLWALTEPPGPDRADAAAVTAYQSWLTTRYEETLDLAREWQREVGSFERVAAPQPDAVPAEQRDWLLFDASVRAEALSRLSRPVHDYLPEVSTALCIPDTRQALARAVQLQSATHLLAIVADDETAVVAQLNTIALDEGRAATVWQQPAITRSRSETASPVEGRGLWRQSIASLARGSRSLSWTVAASSQADSNTPALGTRPAAERVARLLDDYEELLVHSTPVHDPLVVLWDGLSELVTAPDEALSDTSSGHFLTLLGAAGWQPECLDLSALDDETLGEFRAAIVIGHGYLDLESYGRLVVYAVGGGHVLTFGTPIYADESGRRINTRILYPRPSIAPSARGTGLWRRLVNRFRGQHTPILGTESDKVPLASAPLTFEAGPGDNLWWRWHGSRRGPAVAYRAEARQGSTTVIGTPLQTPPTGSSADRAIARRLVTDLLEPLVPRRLEPEPHLSLDLALRQVEPGGVLLFAGNAGPAQRGAIQLRSLEALGLDGPPRADVIAMAGDSSARIADEGSALSVVVDAGDALVVRLQ
ncbi:MAG: hypothetical protein CL878_12090, partial [Dehalococcoidia bacterium]|nr:hypothetical protein [Dehalococcoidia bacterium]